MASSLPFIVCAFGLSWFLAAGFYLLGGRLGTPAGTLLAVAYMFGPLAAAVSVQKRRGEGIKEPLGVRFRLDRWLILAWLLPVPLAFAIFGVSLLLPGVQYTPGHGRVVGALRRRIAV